MIVHIGRQSGYPYDRCTPTTGARMIQRATRGNLRGTPRTDIIWRECTQGLHRHAQYRAGKLCRVGDGVVTKNAVAPSSSSCNQMLQSSVQQQLPKFSVATEIAVSSTVEVVLHSAENVNGLLVPFSQQHLTCMCVLAKSVTHAPTGITVVPPGWTCRRQGYHCRMLLPCAWERPRTTPFFGMH